MFLLLTYEFNFGGSGTNISLLVQRTSSKRSTSVCRTIFTSLAGITRTGGGAWASTGWLGACGALQSRWNDLRWQMQVCAKVFNALVLQVPKLVMQINGSISSMFESRCIFF